MQLTLTLKMTTSQVVDLNFWLEFVAQFKVDYLHVKTVQIFNSH